MASKRKTKSERTDHQVMVRLSKAQYENLAQLAEASAVPLAVFCRSVLVRATQQDRLRGIPSKRRDTTKGVAA